jgi:hypothetical protein
VGLFDRLSLAFGETAVAHTRQVGFQSVRVGDGRRCEGRPGRKP